jgi:hypothetical protein
MSGGTFGVKVMIPDTYPTTVGSFASEAEAEAWIEQSQRRVASESLSGKWFRKTADGPSGG